MTVKELRKYLEKLEHEGKGEYEVVYYSEIVSAIVYDNEKMVALEDEGLM